MKLLPYILVIGVLASGCSPLYKTTCQQLQEKDKAIAACQESVQYLRVIEANK